MLGQAFRAHSHLVGHTDSFHSKTNYPCEYCDKLCKTRLTLKNHLRTRHTNVNGFVCPKCGKGFGLRSRLTVI